MSKRRQWVQRINLANASLAVGGVVTASLVVMAFALQSGTLPATSLPPLPSVSAATSAEPAPLTSIREAMARLNDRQRPFTIAVIGDSTGVPPRAWVTQLGAWVGRTYDRPVNLHPWAVETNRYDSPLALAQTGGGEPVTIWNASATGKGIDYSSEYLREMLPKTRVKSIDLLFINHGHNLLGLTLVDKGAPFVLSLTKKHPETAVILIAQNPETVLRGDTLKAENQETNVAQWKFWADYYKLPVVDVHAVFLGTPNWQHLLIDKTAYHPTVAGYNLWAKTVIGALTH